MDTVIREAEKHDYSSIGNLIKNELGYSNIDFQKLYSRLEQMQADSNYCTFVAECDGKATGYIGLMKGIAFELEDEYLRIIALAVSEDFQHMGIGTKLIERAEEYARVNAIFNISLSSGLQRLGAHAFYEHNGYTKSSFTFKKKLQIL